MSEKRGQLDALLDVELVLGSTTPGSSDSSQLIAGTRLGRYQLARELGAGTMGEVWDARDTELDRFVALKVLRPSLGDGVARARLVREARAMARLRHPNVITVFDAESIDGRDVIAIERIDGTTLASWLAAGHARRDVFAAIVAAGRGLAAAHAAGIVHRDFKPQNVLVESGAGGRVVVTDFGLARAAGETDDAASTMPEFGSLDIPLTMTGAVLGTPAYMAPEQLAGDPADERSDQFAFCATMWEALAGSRPFPGDSMQAIATAMTGAPRASERVPRRLRPILARGLDCDPSRRWPSIDALLAALMRAWRRPRRIAIAIACAAAVALVALVVRHELADRDSETIVVGTSWHPHVIDLPAFEENSDGPAISPDGKQIAYVSDRELTDTFRVYVTLLAGGDPIALTPPGESYMSPRWAHDGKALLLVHWNGSEHRIVRWPLDGAPPVDLGPGTGVDDCNDVLAIAVNGRSFARIELLGRDGQRDVLTRQTSENIYTPRCDRTGQHIVYGLGKTMLHDPIHNLILVDRAGHETVLTNRHATGNPVFTDEGRSIVFSALGDDQVYLFEMPITGGVSYRLTNENGPHLAADVSADGRILAFDRDQGGMMVLAGGGGPTRKLTTRRETLLTVMPTRDGTQLLATRLHAGGNELVVISTRDGSERTLAFGSSGFLANDDRHVLFGSVGEGEPRLQSIALDGGPITTIAKLPGSVASGVDGADASYVEIHRGKRSSETWRVGRDGTVEELDVEGFVMPAPSGGWRLVRHFDGSNHLSFIAPGAPLTTIAHDVHGESSRPTWLDDHRVAYAAHKLVHIVDVTTGTELSTSPGPEWGENAVIAADGVHWYQLELVGHVTRHVIDNFGDRPRPWDHGN